MSENNGTLGQPSEGFNVVELDDEILDATTDKSMSQGQIVLRRFLHHRGAMVSLVIFVLVVLLAFSSIGFGPIPGWWPHSYTRPMEVVNGTAPTMGWFHLGEHPFGQDNVGKDYFALVMRGTQIDHHCFRGGHRFHIDRNAHWSTCWLLSRVD